MRSESDLVTRYSNFLKLMIVLSKDPVKESNDQLRLVKTHAQWVSSILLSLSLAPCTTVQYNSPHESEAL